MQLKNVAYSESSNPLTIFILGLFIQNNMGKKMLLCFLNVQPHEMISFTIRIWLIRIKGTVTHLRTQMNLLIAYWSSTLLDFDLRISPCYLPAFARVTSKPPGNVPTVEANFRSCQIAVMPHHVMPRGPKKTFSRSLTWGKRRLKRCG